MNTAYIDRSEAVKSTVDGNTVYTFEYDVEKTIRSADLVLLRFDSAGVRTAVSTDTGDSVMLSVMYMYADLTTIGVQAYEASGNVLTRVKTASITL